MIRTRCPHCNKLLGIVDSAAGMMTTCPGCKQKFRAPGAKPAAPGAAQPAPAPKVPAQEDFPEVELVEDEEEIAALKAASAPGKRPPVRKADLDADEAMRDDEDEDEAPVKKGGKKKKGKGSRAEKSAQMRLRNRIVGAVGVVGGAFLVWYGVQNEKILNVTAQAKALNPSLESAPRIVTIVFGAVLVLVGGYYLVIDFFRE